jgi:hypothetical protein
VSEAVKVAPNTQIGGTRSQRAELVHREHHRRVPGARSCLAFRDVVELQHPVLLGLVLRVVRLLERLDHLKRDLLLTELGPQALVAAVVDHPLGD